MTPDQELLEICERIILTEGGVLRSYARIVKAALRGRTGVRLSWDECATLAAYDTAVIGPINTWAEEQEDK